MEYRATKILRDEHEVILKVLSRIEETAEKIEVSLKVEPEACEELIEILSLFADRRHHGKEEDLLFPKLQQKGLPTEGGPIAVMLYEHVQGRAYIKEMSAACAAMRAQDKNGAAGWASAARGYVDLLRNHIHKENNILFVMAERMLSTQEQMELESAFEQVEARESADASGARVEMLLRSLTADAAGTRNP